MLELVITWPAPPLLRMFLFVLFVFFVAFSPPFFFFFTFQLEFIGLVLFFVFKSALQCSLHVWQGGPWQQCGVVTCSRQLISSQNLQTPLHLDHFSIFLFEVVLFKTAFVHRTGHTRFFFPQTAQRIEFHLVFISKGRVDVWVPHWPDGLMLQMTLLLSTQKRAVVLFGEERVRTRWWSYSWFLCLHSFQSLVIPHCFTWTIKAITVE